LQKYIGCLWGICSDLSIANYHQRCVQACTDRFDHLTIGDYNLLAVQCFLQGRLFLVRVDQQAFLHGDTLKKGTSRNHQPKRGVTATSFPLTAPGTMCARPCPAGHSKRALFPATWSARSPIHFMPQHQHYHIPPYLLLSPFRLRRAIDAGAHQL
jgi:hypothetical protein